MKTVIRYIKEFWKEDFHLARYLYTFIFIAICITLNYIFNFQQLYVKSAHGGWLEILYYILFYGFAYYGAAIPGLLIIKNKKILKSSGFWIRSSSFILLICFAAGFNEYEKWTEYIIDLADRQYLLSVLGHLKRAVIYIPCLFIFKFIFDKHSKSLFGMSFQRQGLKTYFIIFLIVCPLIIAASFTPDFIIAYPRFKPWLKEPVFGMSKLLMTGIYEFAYGTQYIMVELMFRGALVIGMISILGKKSILPMVAIYTFIHFGKPMGESIAAVFGGYILGIIALQTRQVWGGVIIHLGVAFLMEAMGFVQFYLLGMKR